MEKLMFVETSKGLINLSLVRNIVIDEGDVIIMFDIETDVVIPVDEWHSIRIKMAEAGLLVME
jgi:hypothetical protein